MRCLFLKIGEALAKTEGIELVDRECSDAALGTSRPADEPLPAAALGIDKGCVDDLNQCPVSQRRRRTAHVESIAQTGIERRDLLHSRDPVFEVRLLSERPADPEPLPDC